MAGSSLLALLDDIAAVLDDVAVAAKKTAGVLGDDLALNAEQVSGVKADRELPVVWAVFKGSVKNKFILVPVALLLSQFLPMLITPLLMIGGLYLCYEGFEKVFHLFFHKKEVTQAHSEVVQAISDLEVDMVDFEKNKIKGAIRTDFILSAEIIVIALGTVQAADLSTRISVVTIIAAGITIFVYGLVAGIVKLDDAGLHLQQSANAAKKTIGSWILAFAPYLMKTLSIVGTVAMFLVGGGILVHGLPFMTHLVHLDKDMLDSIPGIGSIIGALAPTLINGAVGIIAGGLAVLSGNIIKLGLKKLKPS